ncbi:alpha-soluble NSF attachment protein [Trichonephila clavipes]|nr:alpha-soluble NSF attachment protein [Trichonephila clavipes]
MEEGCGRENGMKLSLLKSHASVCNTTMVGFDTHCRYLIARYGKNQRYISEVLEPVVLPYLQGLATALFQQDNARPHVERIFQRFFASHQIKLFPWLALSPDLSPIENMWSMVAQ